MILIDEPTKGLAPAIINNMIVPSARSRRDHHPAGRAEFPLRPRARPDGRRHRRRAHRASRPDGRSRRRRGLQNACSACRWKRIRGPRHERLSSQFERYGGVILLPVILALIAFLLIGRPSTWVTLTVAGLAMGMMIFLMASGLSLIFGLMDVLNFGHSAFVSFGAFIAATVLAMLGLWVRADSVLLNMLALMAAIGAATAFGALAGWFFERVIIKPVYTDHLRQILITVGALIVAEEILLVIWGGTPSPCRARRC
jgi:hypothetical protein